MDLSNPSNWYTVDAFEKTAAIVYQDARKIEWIPLPASEFQVSSPILSIYIENTVNAKEHWFLGCWVSLSVRLNNQWQRVKDSGGEFSNRCRLNEYSILTYPYAEPVPYKLKLDFPYWHRGVKVIVQEFVDPSGRYYDPLTEQLQDVIAGEEIMLTNRSTRPSEIDPSLTITRFTQTTKYPTFQVGRFYTTDNQAVGGPMVKVEPYRLIVEFTAPQAIAPNTIKVRITP